MHTDAYLDIGLVWK